MSFPSIGFRRASRNLLIVWLLSAMVLAFACDEQAEPHPSIVSVSSGFSPEPNGFGFANFGGKSDNGLDSASMVRLFGEDVCVDALDGGECSLTPAAKDWMKKTNGHMKGGRCEGFAVLSQLFHMGEEEPAIFGAGNAFDLELDGNAELEREIAYWYATQYLPSIRNKNTTLAYAVDALRMITKEYAQDDYDMYRVGILRMNGAGKLSGGHAVSVLGIEDGDVDSIKYLRIHDNNHPGKKRSIEIDIDANSWSYEAAVNPDAGAALYYGDTDNKNMLWLTATKARLGQHDCHFCAGAEGKGDDPVVLPREVRADGGRVTVRDAYGYRTGCVDGKWVAEVPGSSFAPVYTDDPLSDEVPPVLFLPPGLAIEADIFKGADDEAGVASLSLYGRGYVVGVEDVPLEPAGSDLLTATADGMGVSYRTTTAGSGTVLMGIETADGALEVRVTVAGPADGIGVSITIDEEEGEAKIGADASEEVEVKIEVTVSDADGEEEFVAVVESGGDDEMAVQYDEWQGEGSDMTIEVDTDGDGEPDEVATVAPCEGAACEFGESDNDGVERETDNCPDDYNPGQADSDDDGLGDACDPTP